MQFGSDLKWKKCVMNPWIIGSENVTGVLVVEREILEVMIVMMIH